MFEWYDIKSTPDLYTDKKRGTYLFTCKQYIFGKSPKSNFHKPKLDSIYLEKSFKDYLKFVKMILLVAAFKFLLRKTSIVYYLISNNLVENVIFYTTQLWPIIFGFVRCKVFFLLYRLEPNGKLLVIISALAILSWLEMREHIKTRSLPLGPCTSCSIRR